MSGFLKDRKEEDLWGKEFGLVRVVEEPGSSLTKVMEKMIL